MKRSKLLTITPFDIAWDFIDDLEGMLNKVFACIYSVQVVQLASTNRFYLQFAKEKI